MFKKTPLLLLLLLGLVVTACKAPVGFMSEESKPDEVVVDTIKKGTFVTSEDDIPLSLRYDRDEIVLDRLSIDLLSEDGEVLGSQQLSADELQQDQLPAIKLPELETGLYYLELKGYTVEDTLVIDEKTEFFYVDGTYAVRNIISFPPVINPGTEALLAAQLQVPDQSDPYLRWSMGEETIAEGLLSEGLDKLQWDAPKNEGVYSVKIELFPVTPASGTFTFSSSVSLEIEVFVTRGESGTAGMLFPESSYYSVLHFEGDYTDNGERSSADDVYPIGNPEIDVRGNLFGYYIDEASGFTIDDFILPLDDSGTLRPFSLTMKLYLDEKAEKALFFETTSDSDNFSFSVETDPVDGLSCVLKSKNREIRSTSETDPQHSIPSTFTLSVVPGEEEITFYWFFDGEPVKVEEKQMAVPSLSGEGSAVIGGKGGFTGVIDEFGIFYEDAQSRAATDPYVYSRRVREKMNGTILYADGFDGLYLLDELKAEGEISIQDGKLRIGAGSSVQLPLFTMSHERVEFELEVVPPVYQKPEIDVTLSSQVLPGFVISSEGQVLFEDGTTTVVERSDNTVEMQFLHNDTGFTITVNGTEIAEIESRFDHTDVQIALRQGSDQEPCYLEYVLLHASSLQMVKAEQKTADSEDAAEEKLVQS